MTEHEIYSNIGFYWNYNSWTNVKENLGKLLVNLEAKESKDEVLVRIVRAAYDLLDMYLTLIYTGNVQVDVNKILFNAERLLKRLFEIHKAEKGSEKQN